MRLQLRKPTQSLAKAYARQSITQERMDTFRQALAQLFARLNESKPEEYQRTIVVSFLNETLQSEPVDPTDQPQPDQQSETGNSLPGILIETRKVFAGEMMTPLKNNVKTLHELILAYFDAEEHTEKIAINHLIISDIYNWFIFDEPTFRQFFYENSRLKKLYQLKQQHKKDNAFFYAETAKILRELDDEIPVTYVNLREAADVLTIQDREQANRILLPLVKLFSSEHLLKRPFTNDTNTINRPFYNELLHIIGLQEVTETNRKRIQRLPDGERFEGSLLEQTINLLQVENRVSNFENVGLELCTTWINRILFLKLLEAQLIRYHRGDQNLQFLSPRHIRGFDELGELFFEVMAIPEHQRSTTIVTRFDQHRPEPIPYLNSSLFDPTDLENKTLTISDLNSQIKLALYSETTLKATYGKQQTGKLPTLQYLLTFLNTYDFSPESPADVLNSSKPAINAAALGLIFEKLNGSHDGSYFTPGFLSMYVAQEAIRKAVITRFNERFGWTCTDINSLQSRMPDIGVDEANSVVNSIRIVDLAVGSGRLLVSALNELIALKAELGILVDRTGSHLNRYDISVVNDELLITNTDGELITYEAPDNTTRIGAVWADSSVSESQRVQETIFHEKQTLIESCLFGVDISPNAVNICRLRLWIELLKSTYYLNSSDGSKLSPLPNIDINIHVGNSTASQFGLDFKPEKLRNSTIREKFLTDLRQYTANVLAYKITTETTERNRIHTEIQEFKAFMHQTGLADWKEFTEIHRLETKLAQSALTFDFINQADHFQSLTDQLIAQKVAYANKQLVFQQAFEWRFEFPEVLDETGTYVGFDVVISHPPCAWPDELGNSRKHFQKAFPNTYSKNADAYVLFVELGLHLLRPNGQLAYLLPPKWTQARSGNKLRNWLKTRAIEQILDFSNVPISDEDIALPGMLAVRNATSTGTVSMAILKSLASDPSGLDLSQALVEVPTTSLPEKAWGDLRNLDFSPAAEG